MRNGLGAKLLIGAERAAHRELSLQSGGATSEGHHVHAGTVIALGVVVYRQKYGSPKIANTDIFATDSFCGPWANGIS